MQSYKLGVWKGNHFSIERIRKGHFFCTKWYNIVISIINSVTSVMNKGVSFRKSRWESKTQKNVVLIIYKY